LELEVFVLAFAQLTQLNYQITIRLQDAMARFIFLVSLISLGNAVETGECVLGSEASCGGQDSSVLLQGRMRVNEDVKGGCSADDDTNCCFTQAGVDVATEKVGPGATVGMCAAGGKAVAGDQWATLLVGLETCKDDACSSNAIPTNGTCAGYTCPQGMNQRTTNYLPTAPCTNAATCEFNCCQTDVNGDPVRRNGILTYSALWTVVNVTRISTQIGFPNGQADPDHLGDEYAADMQELHDHSEGLRTVMGEINASMAAEYCPGQSASGDFTHLTHIKSCVDKSMCVMAANEKTEEDIKTITMLREYYGKFEDISWEYLWEQLNVAKIDSEGGLKQEQASPFGNKDIDFMAAAELACQGITDFVDELDGSTSLTQMDTQAAAYQISAALYDAAKTTHALLDSISANSSMDANLAALHRAWEPPCKMLNCDNTNYWDLLGASHSHSIALIESGASAHHMHVHVRTRGRLEVRMQLFLATEEGRKYGSKIYRVEGSTSESRMNQYVSYLKDNLHQVLTNHPKKYGLDSTLLSLFNRKHMKRFFRTPVQSRLLDAFLDKSVYMVASEKELDQLAEIQALVNEEELSEEDEKRLHELIHKTLIFKKVGRFFSKVGKGINAAVNTIGKGIVTFGKAIGKAASSAVETVGNGIIKAAKWIDKAATTVANGVVDMGKAIGKGIVSGITAFGEAVVTIATAVGNAITAFIDFIIDLLACLGFGTASTVGYGKKFPCPVFSWVSCAPTMPCPPVPPCPIKFGVTLSISVWLGSAISDLLKGIVVNYVGISLGVTVGFVPGGASEPFGGIRVGVGIAISLYCKGTCLVEISVGAVAAAIFPIPYSPRCVLGPKVFGFGCSESFGITMLLLCCKIDITTGCQSCGKGGCEGAGGESAPSGSSKAEIDKAIESATSCDENLSGKGQNYRGCQTRSKSGKECQKWTSQYPHTHNFGTKATNNQNGLGNHAMCRNPNNHPTIWCLTKDPNKRWENCEVFQGVYKSLEDGGGAGFRRRMSACQGDCDSNNDCSGSGRCHMRDTSAQTVPGCTPGGTADKPTHDYCTDIFLDSGGEHGYRRRFKACQGDCDSDVDCKDDLKCFYRASSQELVPGCGYSGSGDIPTYDYCVLGSPLKNGGNGGYRRRMPTCTGDCDQNWDCASGRCFQRSQSGQEVPGCLMGGDGDKPTHDYCTEGTILKDYGNRGYRRRMAPCEGDCDRNADCSSGKCFQRNHYSQVVPGCMGGNNDDKPTHDYCHD